MIHFVKGYFVRGGCLDGAHGFIIACMCSFGAFLKYAKLWELNVRQKSDFKEMPDIH
jgi:hypothetical protein